MERDKLEYVTLRRLRRGLLTEDKLRSLGRVMSRAQMLEPEEFDPWAEAETDAGLIAPLGVGVAGARVLVVGAGPSNGLGYALAALGAAKVVCHDAAPGFDVGEDATHLAAMTTRFPKVKFTIVGRYHHLENFPDAGCELVVSLAGPGREPDPRALAAVFARVLAPGGVLIHHVDCRDRFLRYPYHSLLFSQKAWKKLADPGEQDRWRLDDHIQALTGAGFDVTVPRYESDAEAFAAVADRLDAAFANRDQGLVSVTRATLVGRLRRPEALPGEGQG